MDTILEVLGNIKWESFLPVILGLGIVWKYASKVLLAMKEVGELMIAIYTATADDKKIDEEEKAIIKKEAREAIEALKQLFKKK